VVAVTAFAMKATRNAFAKAAAAAYLSKPISSANYIETVRRFIG